MACIFHEVRHNSYSVATNFRKNAAPEVKSLVLRQHKIIILNKSILRYSASQNQDQTQAVAGVVEKSV